MDEGVVRMAAQMYSIVAEIEGIKARIESCKAANEACAIRGELPEYSERIFINLSTELFKLSERLKNEI